MPLDEAPRKFADAAEHDPHAKPRGSHARLVRLNALTQLINREADAQKRSAEFARVAELRAAVLEGGDASGIGALEKELGVSPEGGALLAIPSVRAGGGDGGALLGWAKGRAMRDFLLAELARTPVAGAPEPGVRAAPLGRWRVATLRDRDDGLLQPVPRAERRDFRGRRPPGLYRPRLLGPLRRRRATDPTERVLHAEVSTLATQLPDFVYADRHRKPCLGSNVVPTGSSFVFIAL